MSSKTRVKAGCSAQILQDMSMGFMHSNNPLKRSCNGLRTWELLRKFVLGIENLQSSQYLRWITLRYCVEFTRSPSFQSCMWISTQCPHLRIW